MRALVAGCAAHVQEAAAVHRALERLSRRRHPVLHLEATIGDILGRAGKSRVLRQAATLLEAMKLTMALEAEYGPVAFADVDQLTADAAGAVMLRVLLGPAAKHSTWAGETIWMRSVRGVVNERVRWRGGCACV